MKHYETIFIINPNLSEEEYGETLTKFRDLIDKSKGIMIKVEEWGKQKLAYQLMKFDSGTYVLFDYCGEAGMTVELERILKLDERILKYQTVKLADQADPETLIKQEEESKRERTIKAAEEASQKDEESKEVHEPTDVGGPFETEASSEVEETVEAVEPVQSDDSAEAEEAPEEADDVSVTGDEETKEAGGGPDQSDEEPAEKDEGISEEDVTPEEDMTAKEEGEKGN